MICARCGYKSDENSSLCPRCGLDVDSPGPGSPPPSLLPGTALRNGLYRLQERVGYQEWPAGAFEAMWTGHSMQRKTQVMIREVAIPAATPEQTRSIMHAATMSLLSLQRYPSIAPLLDAFSDHGRSFFIFAPVPGETLLARQRRLRSPLPEREVVQFCLQMTDILEVLSQKTPPLVHGLIRPEHVHLSSDGSHYLLSNFSILVAGRATAFFANGDESQIARYTAPEFAHGKADTRTDLYAVLATAYHLATGSAPLRGYIPPRAQSLNPALSPDFDAILDKGLSLLAHQRYQHPSQLRQDLRALRLQDSNSGLGAPTRERGTISGHLVGQADARPSFSGVMAPETTIPPFPQALQLQKDEARAPLPAPELLPPMRMGNDRLVAAAMLAVILLSLGVMTALSNFHV